MCKVKATGDVIFCIENVKQNLMLKALLQNEYCSTCGLIHATVGLCENKNKHACNSSMTIMGRYK